MIDASVDANVCLVCVLVFMSKWTKLTKSMPTDWVHAWHTYSECFGEPVLSEYVYVWMKERKRLLKYPRLGFLWIRCQCRC